MVTTATPSKTISCGLTTLVIVTTNESSVLVCFNHQIAFHSHARDWRARPARDRRATGDARDRRARARATGAVIHDD